MRLKALVNAVILVVGFAAYAASQTAPDAPLTSMRRLMLDVIHPSANDILLITHRGAPVSAADWSLLRRSATTLTEAGRLLAAPERRRDRNDWLKYANEMARIGEAASAGAQTRDLGALRNLTAALDASCTDCHRRYRPNVFASEGGSR